MGISSAKADSSRCAGSADGYVESLDPLAGKEEAQLEETERDEALLGRNGRVRAGAHWTHHTPDSSS
jgi:hypothetical protein